MNCNKPQQRNDPDQVQRFNAANECEYCSVKFSEEVKKVWHHCHISGKLIAAVCQRCNTRIRQPTAVLPVLVHNLKNYDMHAFCLEGFSQMPGWRLKPICQTREKYLTLTAQMEVDRDDGGRPIYFSIRFVDSCQIVTGSLDRMVKSLGFGNITHARQMRDRFGQVDDDVLFQKGVFPYSYLDQWNKLEDVALPPLAAFFDTLTNSQRTSEEEYQRGQRAWQQFNCQSMQDYMLRYLELDCRLLADVFENFRRTTLDQFQLDAVNFITLPQLTFAAAFRFCKVDLITEEDMYQFFEDGIRGGMCFVNKHLVTADENTHIAYWDENNLYGGALRELLPCADFKWMERRDFEALDWTNINTDGEYGYTLKLDLEYPENIHDKTQDFPLAPEPAVITEDMITPFMRQQWTRLCELREQPDSFTEMKKLLMTCRDKKEYVVHFKLLKFYLKMGMRITRIHSVVKFKQASIFKKYIDENSRRRSQANSEFVKDLYKLLNNALFGKTMENVRGRKDFRLPNTEEAFKIDTSKPQFLQAHRFSEDLALTEMLKLEVKLDKPIFIGQAVLDLSKLTMFQLRYEKLTDYERRFDCRISVLAGDTDSLICSIENMDLQLLHREMLKDGLLDTSNYDQNHPLFTDNNKAKLGCIKDEVQGDFILEAVLLKPKAYSLRTLREKTCKKAAKGVQKCIREGLSHEEYAAVYRHQDEVGKVMRRFQSTDHVVHTIKQEKWALSVVDNKRAWISKNESLPYGHFRLDGPPAAKRPRL